MKKKRGKSNELMKYCLSSSDSFNTLELQINGENEEEERLIHSNENLRKKN